MIPMYNGRKTKMHPIKPNPDYIGDFPAFIGLQYSNVQMYIKKLFILKKKKRIWIVILF